MEPGKPTECPVVHAWSQSEFVLKRLLEKNLLILNGSRLSRGTVIANQELLIPLINLVGSSEASSSMYCVSWMSYTVCANCKQTRSGLRPSVDLVATYLQRLYAGYRPMHKPIPDGTSIKC